MKTKPMATPMNRPDLEYAQLRRRTATRLALAKDAMGHKHILDKSNPPVNWGQRGKEVSLKRPIQEWRNLDPARVAQFWPSARQALVDAKHDLLALAEALELMVTTYDEGGNPTATIAIARAALAALHQPMEELTHEM